MGVCEKVYYYCRKANPGPLAHYPMNVSVTIQNTTIEILHLYDYLSAVQIVLCISVNLRKFMLAYQVHIHQGKNTVDSEIQIV